MCIRDRGATSLPFIKRVGCGLVSGAAAAIISNPAEVAIVRMQVDKSLPAAERRNYRNVGDALVRAGKEEGLRALWKGSVSCHDIAGIWVTFSSSGSHDSQDASDIVADRPSPSCRWWFLATRSACAA